MTAAVAIDWQRVPLGRNVTVLRTHACGLAALAKPAGVLSHPNRAGDAPRSLLAAEYDVENECFVWNTADGAGQRVWLLHRLDSATSGVVLVAAREAIAAAVREAFAQRRVHKRYLALVLGHPRENEAVWRDAMEVRRERGVARARSAAASSGLPAETAMRVVRRLPGPPALTLLELEPRTGRTHQLRHQCARRHLPIVGDQTYGNFRLNRELARRFATERLFLHASRVELTFAPRGGESVSFAAEAPLPPEFAAVAGSPRSG